MNKTVSNFLLGFLAGAAAGAIAGILFAPDKGSKTRKNIREKVRGLSDELGLGLGELIDELDLETEAAPHSTRKGPSPVTGGQTNNEKRKYTRKTRNPKSENK